KTVGVTAVGAAAIATLVTVLVYNGRAEVSGNDHAMTVTPGTTVAVRAGDIPGLDAIGNGVAAQRTEIDRLREQLAEKERRFAALEESVRKLGGVPGGKTVPPSSKV